MNTAQINYDSKTGKYYYVGLRPLIKTKVSCDENGNFNLRGEDSFDKSNIIGDFIGYPATCKSENLDYGFNFSEGYILFEDGSKKIVRDGLIYKNDIIINNTDNNNRNGNINLLRLQPYRRSCTPIATYVDINNHLSIEKDYNNELVCGVFYGQPGKYITGKSYSNRIYGFNYSTGVIILNNTKQTSIPYLKEDGEFQYKLYDGVLLETKY
jgi:hypothetical protein